MIKNNRTGGRVVSEDKTVAVAKVRALLAVAETAVKELDAGRQGSREFHAMLVAARRAITEADAGLRRLNRKPDEACAFQLCWETATRVHEVEATGVKVAFCD